MRILFLGDIVGRPGVAMIRQALPLVVKHEQIDLVVANAENVSGGSGLNQKSHRELKQAGIQIMTMGDHVYKRHEIMDVFQTDDSICRPANYPAVAPGRDFVQTQLNDGTAVIAFCLLGRTFMRPVDCPFQAADRVLQAIPPEVKCILVDIHAEATADKYLMLHHLKGRVSAILGTHTHVPTADEQITPEGTAYITDVGMSGPHDSILGRQIDRVLSTTVTFVPSAFDVAEGDVRLNGAIVDIEAETGRALAIRRYKLDENGLQDLKTRPKPPQND
jgi:metallophosphoesterase (TIGR00282 family)